MPAEEVATALGLVRQLRLDAARLRLQLEAAEGLREHTLHAEQPAEEEAAAG